MAFDMSALSDWIATELKKRSWSIRELARRAGISHTTVSEVLQETRLPTFDFCAAIARPLGRSPVFVFRLAGLIDEAAGQINEERAAYQAQSPTLREIWLLINDMSPEKREQAADYIRYLHGQDSEYRGSEGEALGET